MTGPDGMAPPQKIAVVGAGVIGASWSAQFLAAGLDVIATDPAPGAEERLRQDVAAHWPVMQQLGLADTASIDRLGFTADLAEALADADLVQENGPERVEFKQELFATMDAATDPEVILASSSSGIGPTTISARCTVAPGRVIVAHPFNPPHLIPLVEVVGGQHADGPTDERTIERAMTFYRSIGKQPIHVKIELPGHIANRLQAALWREAYDLVDRGAVSVDDLERAISAGPGLRWALLGPLTNQHLSGGRDGLAHVLEHLGPPMVGWWDTLGHPEWTDSLKEKLVAGTNQQLSRIDEAAMVEERDRLLVDLLAAKARSRNLPEHHSADHHSDQSRESQS